MVALILALKELERYTGTIPLTDTGDVIDEDKSLDKKFTELVTDITSMATTNLITDGGKCHWGNIGLLRDNGYDVFPLERDSFGWLVGGIRTSKGIIAYG